MKFASTLILRFGWLDTDERRFAAKDWAASVMERSLVSARIYFLRM